MRMIDADVLERKLMVMPDEELCEDCCYNVVNAISEMPTVGGWISVKDDLPKEHDSIFAHMPLVRGMWAKDSDTVIVYVRLPDGTGQATEGGLHDGEWWTRISSALDPVVTHWQPFPEPPEEGNG